MTLQIAYTIVGYLIVAGICMALILKYLNGCKHKYKIIEKINYFGNGERSSMPTSIKFVLQCEHCGKIKVKHT